MKIERLRMICPECGALVYTTNADAMIWRQCPGCGRHMWDRYDMMLADRVQGEESGNPEFQPSTAHFFN